MTGHTGFVGLNIAKYLNSKGMKVIGLSRSKTNNKVFENEIQLDLLNPSIDNYERFVEINDLSNIGCIIHSAAILANPENLKSIDLLRDNIAITETIIGIALAINPERFINISSMSIYPNIDKEFTEKDCPDISGNADGIYGLSKLCSENLFGFYFKGKIDLTHLRLSQVYGDGMRSDRIHVIMKEELLKDNTISVWGEGERVNNFIHTDKVSDTIHRILTSNVKSGVFNLGGENLSYKELALDIIDKFGNDKSTLTLVNKGLRSKFYLNSDKIEAALANN